MMTFNQVKELIGSSPFSDIEVIEIDPSKFVFEERVKQKCYHCKNYNYKWTCPPKIPTVDYPKLFTEYDNAAVLIIKLPIVDGNIEEPRTKSTNFIHRALLFLESELYKNNNSFALSFIGGSCKLCKNGCGKDRCVNPYLSRMPWEATGCNIVKSLSNIGVDIIFPPQNEICRYGLFLW